MAGIKSINLNMLSKPNGKRKKYNDPCLDLTEAGLEVNRNANAVTLIVRTEDLREQQDGIFRLVTKPFYQRVIAPKATLSDDFFFRSAPSSYNLGTGFFIEKDVIATAGHVLFPTYERVKLSDLSFIRGVFTDDGFEQIRKEQIYKARYKELKAEHFRMSQSSSDWALIPVKLEDYHQDFVLPNLNPYGVSFGAEVYGLGHGFGLSLKLNNLGAKVVFNNSHLPYFECNLPAFVSSSGAPIFNAKTHDLIGMLIRGTNQLEIDKYNVIHWHPALASREGEECQRLDPLLTALHVG